MESLVDVHEHEDEFSDSKYWWKIWSSLTDFDAADDVWNLLDSLPADCLRSVEPDLFLIQDIRRRSDSENWNASTYQSLVQQAMDFCKNGSMSEIPHSRLGNTVRTQRRNFCKDKNIENMVNEYRQRRDRPIMACFLLSSGNVRISNLPVRGNHTYQRNVMKRFNEIVGLMEPFMKLSVPGETNALNLTFTFGKQSRGIQSWFKFTERWNRYRSYLRKRYGPFIQTWVKECHTDGTLHLHCIMIFLDHMFGTFEYKGKIRIDEKPGFADGWKYGTIDIVALSSKKDAFEYMVKYLGKGFAMEFDENSSATKLRKIRMAELGIAISQLTGSRQYFLPSKSYLQNMAKKFLPKDQVDLIINKQVTKTDAQQSDDPREFIRMIGVTLNPNMSVKKTYAFVYPNSASNDYRQPPEIEHGLLWPVIQDDQETVRLVEELGNPEQLRYFQGGMEIGYWEKYTRYRDMCRLFYKKHKRFPSEEELSMDG